MKKYFLIVVAVVFVFNTPLASAQTVNVDALLLRIDALILEMQLVKKQVETISGSSASVPTGSVLGAATSVVFTESLANGETNEDIRKIQKLLATDPEIYPYGVASGFFGPKTEEAIRNLQTRFDLDPVGVIGPATTALLEGYMRMYPDGNYPTDALSQKPQPQVLGITTPTTTVISTTVVPTTNVISGTNPLRLVSIELDKGEAPVEVFYVNGDKDEFVADGDDEDEIIRYISHRLGVKEAFVRAAAAVDEYERDNNDDDNDYDEDDAEDYIDEADEAIDDAEDDIFDAELDGDDVDYALDTLDEAEEALDDAEDALDEEEYDDAVKYAKEAKSLAKKAEDRIGEDKDRDGEKGDSDDIDSIVAEVDEDEAEITVEYDDGSEYVFTVEEDKRDEIIEEVADELDMDEDDVEDLIEFDYGRIDTIEVLIGDGEAEVDVEYRSGVRLRFVVDEDDEDDIIEVIADELDEDEEDVEDVINFDYL